MKTLKMLWLLGVLVSSLGARADIKVLFHPMDPTLTVIAQHIREAKSSVNIAMYNMDGDLKNPVIAQIASAETQERLKSGSLSIRMIYEGYDGATGNQTRMQKLEDFGIDVRSLASSKKMHHKFAVIDIETSYPKLITGSANWSMSSQNNYSENILFFENHPGLSTDFFEQFQLLWNSSKEFGRTGLAMDLTVANLPIEPGLAAHFNTDNFRQKANGSWSQLTDDNFTLTRQIVAAIDRADHRIRIATTRIKLRPIYEALLRAAARGVEIQIVVTMGEYETAGRRAKAKVPSCDNEFERTCSSNKNFSVFLGKNDFPGHENVDVRFKFFHVNLDAYLNKQMHSKYILIDDKEVLTGSFNWSYSAEYGHIENLVTIKADIHADAFQSFQNDFAKLYELNRSHLKPLVEGFEVSLREGKKVECGFEPMTITASEIDWILSVPKRAGRPFKGHCL